MVKYIWNELSYSLYDYVSRGWEVKEVGLLLNIRKIPTFYVFLESFYAVFQLFHQDNSCLLSTTNFISSSMWIKGVANK